MRRWEEFTHFAGFDWASDHHDVVVVDKSGAVILDFRFDDTAEGWGSFQKTLAPLPAVALTIETSQGATVERLLQADLVVYPINPRSAKRYRERKASSGVNSDRLAAWSFADALRLDGHGWRPLQQEDPIILELRQLCRDERGLIADRTAITNRLRQALKEYFPAALEAFEDLTLRAPWQFVIAFPTPDALVRAGKRRWENFLHRHKLFHPATYQKRLAVFARATEFRGSPGTTAAKSLLAVSLAKMLLTLQDQIDAFETRIQQAYESHPDHDLFGSLPGAGTKTSPRLLGEIGSDRARFDCPEALQALAGTAPVTWQSGKFKKVKIRWAVNKHLRYAVHWLAQLSRESCPWAEIYYQQKKKQGKSHATALRCLGQRWLKILWKMWRTRTRYDADLHQKNQVRHGSWVLQLATEVKE